MYQIIICKKRWCLDYL